MNIKRIRCRAALTAMTLLWMLLIFIMSGANDDASKAQSGSICRFLCETFVEGFEDLPTERQMEIEESLSFPVRKCAHFTEYTVLGLLLTLTTAAWLPSGQDGPAEDHDPLWPDHSADPADPSGSRAELLPAGRGLCRADFALPFLTGVLYAVSDEIHQTFVPGRAGQIRDVLIDSCGVLAGILLARALHGIFSRRAGSGG